ncbi:MAG: preprotein translocase subunit SecA [Pedobacter sp.]|nr:MAG: preprotein translocase subunit SecA [Pedobacter sp.]
MEDILKGIHYYASSIKDKSNEELKNLIGKFQEYSFAQFSKKKKAEWFALVHEIGFRSIGLRAFDTQLMAGLLLTEGKIVEMKTGEGKTLVSTFPSSYYALQKNGVHVVTVNEYLAERDQKWMGKVYSSLGFSSSLVKETDSTCKKKASYLADITYLTKSEVVFDYLRDNTAFNVGEIVQRPFSFCLIDEIDSVLIDEARTPLILSDPESIKSINKLHISSKIASRLQKEVDFEVDEKRKDLSLTEVGHEKAKRLLGKRSLYDPKDPWILEILNALRATQLYKANKDYIVLKEKIVIVDDFTGRIMEDRRWSFGLHEAIEVKENVPIGKKTKTKTSITYQKFFTLYPILSGMTGTAETAKEEFRDIYGLDVVVIPPHKPFQRKDLPDAIYQNEAEKWKAILKETKICYKKGQPILIGTASIEKSELLSDLLKASKIPHQVLNAKPENVLRENEIIAQAGKFSAVTIATNMAGRGTDIILGGNPYSRIKEFLRDFFFNRKNLKSLPPFLVLLQAKFANFEQKIINDYHLNAENQKECSFGLLEGHIKNLPYGLEECKPSLQSFYQYLSAPILEDWAEENKRVKELGGLFVLGTERHETRRIDDQLRGRAGRQGDPGLSRFIVSLDDNLLKIFGSDNLRDWVKSLLKDDESPLEADFLTRSLEKAQQNVERYNYELRKSVFQYDSILNVQRKQLIAVRKEILCGKSLEELILRWQENLINEKISRKELNENSEILFSMYLTYATKKNSGFFFDPFRKSSLSNASFPYEEIWIQQDLRWSKGNLYQEGLLQRTRLLGNLFFLDLSWTEHLEQMDSIKETIYWRSYGQQNPLAEYQEEAVASFRILLEKLRNSLVYSFGNQFS